MKKMFLSLVSAALAAGLSVAWADDVGEGDSAIQLGEVVVTATKSSINKRETGASITVITEKEIEQKGKPSVIDLLTDVPGITIVRESQFGGKANVFLRGARAGNVLVLVDGVEVNDPSGVDRSFDFAHLTTDNIERIEVLRGPQSMLYGSDATGGVINIISKRGKGAPVVTVKAEAGSYSTFRESVSVSGGNDEAHYSFAASRTDSRGFSQAEKIPGSVSEPERDGYFNTTVSSRLGFRVNEMSWLNFAIRYTDAMTEIDDGGYSDNPNYKAYSKNISIYSSFEQSLTQWWNHNLSVMYLDTYRRYRDIPETVVSPNDINGWYQGNQKKVEWRHELKVLNNHTILTGVEYRIDEVSLYERSDYGFGYSDNEMNEKKVYNIGVYFIERMSILDMWYVTGGLRADRHEEFGTHVTGQVNSSFIVPYLNTRLKALFGTGFKAPSVYQLYDTSYGNKNLNPELSTSMEAGIEQPFFNNNLIVEMTYFSIDYEDMFGYDPNTYKTINIGAVEARGVENMLTLRIAEIFSLSASYTYMKTRDAETGENLPRRPRHQGSVNLNWEFLPGGNINLGYSYGGKRNDVWFEGFTQHDVVLDSFHRIDIYASFWITGNFQVFGRIDNIIDEDYMTVAGYSTTGRAFYGGIKGRF